MVSRAVQFRFTLILTEHVHTLCIMSIVAPVHASPILFIHPSDDECQEIADEFPSTIMGRKTHLKFQQKSLMT